LKIIEILKTEVRLHLQVRTLLYKLLCPLEWIDLRVLRSCMQYQ